MKKQNIYAVILAGGSGTRFWPLSRKATPKQFLKIIGEHSLFENTILRIRSRVFPKNIFIVTNKLYARQAVGEIKPFGIPRANILAEPEGKNTAPAIGWVAGRIYSRDKNAVMMVLPSDHLITDSNKFLKNLDEAVVLARQNYLVTVGITPTRPETGYGYLKVAKRRAGNKTVWGVAKFIEKPNLARAKKFFKNGSYLWNGGIFIWRAEAILSEFAKHLPAIYYAFEKRSDAKHAVRIWSKLPSISIDYGILEKAGRIVTVPAKGVGWSDVGSWDALSGVLKKDKNKNTFQGKTIDIESKNICVIGGKRLIVTVGLNGLTVVDTPDALLLCRRDLSQKIRDVVSLLKKQGRGRYLL